MRDQTVPEEVELVSGILVRALSSKDGVFLQSVLEQLKQRGYELNGARIWHYSARYDWFVFCALGDPQGLLTISTEDFVDGVLMLRIGLSDSLPQKKRARGEDENENGRRTKERDLSVIIWKVCRWRELFHGCYDKNGKKIKLTLEEAAAVVGLPKKTLDDYLQELKKGKMAGFDFSAHRGEKIGVLRSAVKEYNEKHPGRKRKKEEKQETKVSPQCGGNST